MSKLKIRIRKPATETADEGLVQWTFVSYLNKTSDFIGAGDNNNKPLTLTRNIYVSNSNKY